MLKGFYQLYFTMNKFVFFLLFLGCLTSLGQKSSQTAQRLPQQSIKSVLKSETTLQLLAKHGKGTIRLRWVAQTPEIWALGRQYGYVLERTTIIRKNKKLAKPDDLKTFTLLPATAQEWDEAMAKDAYVKASHSIYMDKPEELTEKDSTKKKDFIRGKYAFSSLTADFSFLSAQLMRLGFEDKQVIADEVYQYKVHLNYNSYQSNKAFTSIIAGLELTVSNFKPESLTDLDYVDSTTTLRWKVPQDAIFSGYIIESSDDNGVTFHRVTTAPYVPIENSAKEKDEVLYANKVKTLMQTYYYRVRGIDPFGEESRPSNVIKVFAFQSNLPEANQLTSHIINKKTVAIKWAFPDSLNANLSGFKVYKTKNFKEYKPVTKSTIGYQFRYTVDQIEEGDENLYYIVSRVDLRGREKSSEPLLVSFIDSIPPVKLNNLKGNITKKGIVTISWKHGGERDLYGFNVLRAEGDTPHLLHTIKTINRPDTSLVDTIPMIANTRKVLYMIVPIDYHSNAPIENDTLVLYRPDVIPPKPPVLNASILLGDQVSLKWLPSSSVDVASYQLYKQYLPDTTLRLVHTFPLTKDTISYKDGELEEGKTVKYLLRAIDQEGLVSNDSAYVHILLTRPHRLAAIDSIVARYDEATQQVQVKWKYPSKRSIQSFYVFRKKDNEPFLKHKTISGKLFEFTDKIQSSGNYSYQLIAHSTDDILSRKSKPITLKIQVKKSD